MEYKEDDKEYVQRHQCQACKAIFSAGINKCPACANKAISFVNVKKLAHIKGDKMFDRQGNQVFSLEQEKQDVENILDAEPKE